MEVEDANTALSYQIFPDMESYMFSSALAIGLQWF